MASTKPREQMVSAKFCLLGEQRTLHFSIFNFLHLKTGSSTSFIGFTEGSDERTHYCECTRKALSELWVSLSLMVNLQNILGAMKMRSGTLRMISDIQGTK